MACKQLPPIEEINQEVEERRVRTMTTMQYVQIRMMQLLFKNSRYMPHIGDLPSAWLLLGITM
jgi:hypothetical protein